MKSIFLQNACYINASISNSHEKEREREPQTKTAKSVPSCILKYPQVPFPSSSNITWSAARPNAPMARVDASTFFAIPAWGAASRKASLLLNNIINILSAHTHIHVLVHDYILLYYTIPHACKLCWMKFFLYLKILEIAGSWNPIQKKGSERTR